MAKTYLIDNEMLKHYGTKGMHWGVRRYQRYDGTLTEAGKKRYSGEGPTEQNHQPMQNQNANQNQQTQYRAPNPRADEIKRLNDETEYLRAKNANLDEQAKLANRTVTSESAVKKALKKIGNGLVDAASKAISSTAEAALKKALAKALNIPVNQQNNNGNNNNNNDKNKK